MAYTFSKTGKASLCFLLTLGCSSIEDLYSICFMVYYTIFKAVYYRIRNCNFFNCLSKFCRNPVKFSKEPLLLSQITFPFHPYIAFPNLL